MTGYKKMSSDRRNVRSEDFDSVRDVHMVTAASSGKSIGGDLRTAAYWQNRKKGAQYPSVWLDADGCRHPFINRGHAFCAIRSSPLKLKFPPECDTKSLWRPAYRVRYDAFLA